MEKMTRRSFINASAMTIPLILTHSRSGMSANDQVQIALIGCGGRGRFVTRGLIESGAVCTYLCDLRDDRLDEAEQFLSSVQTLKPKRAKNMRTVFDSKDVDAVVIATPDHWHGPASILAVQAGKDVYVEKPHAHNVFESQKMVEASHKYNRIIQAGTQNRSAPYNLQALEYVKSGKLGQIGLVKVYNLEPGKGFTLGSTKPCPAGFDWDTWLGPAPERPYHDKIFKSGWHKYWDFSGGDFADDGIHQFDLALMLMGNPDFPTQISCFGDQKIFKDDREVPDVQIATYMFRDFIMTFELTNYPRYMQKTTSTIRRNDELPYWTQNATRIELYGSELMMTIGRHGGGWQVMTSGGKVVDQMYGRPADFPHYINFLDSVKTRKMPNADVSIAHNACTMVHLANIAHRIGNMTLQFDGAKQQILNNDSANRLLKRQYRKNYEVSDQV